jgi:hypothetical protein
MIGLWSGAFSPNAIRLHAAFRTSLDHVLGAVQDLRSHGVEPLDFGRNRPTQPSVIVWIPAGSMFFRDPDGHLLEYLAVLSDNPNRETGVVTYKDWLEGTGQKSEPAEPRLPPANLAVGVARCDPYPKTECQRGTVGVSFGRFNGRWASGGVHSDPLDNCASFRSTQKLHQRLAWLGDLRRAVQACGVECYLLNFGG